MNLLSILQSSYEAVTNRRACTSLFSEYYIIWVLGYRSSNWPLVSEALLSTSRDNSGANRTYPTGSRYLLNDFQLIECDEEFFCAVREE